MGLKLVVKGADFSAIANGYLPAVADGLEYLNFFGGSQKTLARNLAPGKAAAAVVGAPTVNTNGALFSYLERLVKTGVVQTESCTLIVVARAPSSANPIWRHLVSNFGRDNGTGGLKWGASLAFKLDAADVRLTLGLLATAAGGAASSTGAVAPAALGSLSFSAARVDAVARTASIDNKTTGVARSATYANTYKPELNGEFYIGSAAGLRADTAGVDVEVMFAAIYSRALSDAELAAVYQSVKIFYAARGLTI